MARYLVIECNNCRKRVELDRGDAGMANDPPKVLLDWMVVTWQAGFGVGDLDFDFCSVQCLNEFEQHYKAAGYGLGKPS